MFRFERLQVWHKAVALYELADTIAGGFPPNLRFSLSDQLTRAAFSISSNIVEGTGRETQKENHHFFTVAKASTFELVSILTVAHRRGLTSAEHFRTAHDLAEEISRMLTALKRGPRERSAPDSRL